METRPPAILPMGKRQMVDWLPPPVASKRVGLYPGTFDPITNGHLDVIGRAARILDRLVVGVAINLGKGPLFELDERVDLVRRETREIAERCKTVIDVVPFKDLLVDFARREGASMIGRRRKRHLARNVIFAGGVMGTVPLLLKLKASSDGLPKLSDGIDFVVVAMGMFGLAEIIGNIEARAGTAAIRFSAAGTSAAGSTT